MSSIDHGSTDAAPRGRHAAPDSGDPEVLEAPATAVDEPTAAAAPATLTGRELAKYDAGAGAIVVPTPIPGLALTFTRDQKVLDAEQMHMLAPLGIEATWDPAQVAVFLMLCAERGFNPWAKEAYLMLVDGKYIHHIGINGLRRKSEETGEYVGMVGPQWCGPDGVWREVWLDRNVPPAAARVGILRKGFDGPVWGVATYDEFAPMITEKVWDEERRRKVPTGQKVPMANWKTAANGGKPSVMLLKCAEAAGRRLAFPTKFSGFYVAEEFDKVRAEAAERAGTPTVDVDDPAAARRRAAYAEAQQAAADSGPVPVFVGLGISDDEARRMLLAELDEQCKIMDRTRGEITARWSAARGGLSVEQAPLRDVENLVRKGREYALAALREQGRTAEADRYMHAPPVADVETLFGRAPQVIDQAAEVNA